MDKEMIDPEHKYVGLLPVFIDEVSVSLNKDRYKNYGFIVTPSHISILAFCLSATSRGDVGKLPIPAKHISKCIRNLDEHGYLHRDNNYTYLKTTQKGVDFIKFFYNRVDLMCKRFDKSYEYFKDRNSSYHDVD